MTLPVVSAACMFMVLPAFWLVLHEPLLFAFEDGIQGSKTLFPSASHVLDPDFKLGNSRLIDPIETLLRPFFHQYEVCLTEHFKMLRDGLWTDGKVLVESGSREFAIAREQFEN